MDYRVLTVLANALTVPGRVHRVIMFVDETPRKPDPDH